MKIVSRALLLALVIPLAACSDMNQEQKRMAGGTAIGAAGGLAIGAIAGNAGAGAAIGAGVGLLGGVLANQHEKAKADSYNAGYQAGQQSKQ
jgi:hypothetical protein